MGINDTGSPFAGLPGPTPGPWGINDGSPRCILGMTNGLQLRPKRPKPASAKKDALEIAFDRADELGWVPYFRDAAEANDFTPALAPSQFASSECSGPNAEEGSRTPRWSNWAEPRPPGLSRPHAVVRVHRKGSNGSTRASSTLRNRTFIRKMSVRRVLQ